MSHVTKHTLMTTHTHPQLRGRSAGESGGSLGRVLEGRGVLVTKISHMMQEVSANWTLVDRKGHLRPLLAQIPTST